MTHSASHLSTRGCGRRFLVSMMASISTRGRRSLPVYRPGSESPNPISHEANGVLSMLMLLAQVASANRGGIVAIDEPEHALHPFAIRRFVDRARAWARQHDLTILLTTHSPVLLNQFNAEPEQIFVLERGYEVLPVRLDELRDRNWLANYTIGEFYVDSDFAANENI
jgi:predicted ATPase